MKFLKQHSNKLFFLLSVLVLISLCLNGYFYLSINKLSQNTSITHSEEMQWQLSILTNKVADLDTNLRLKSQEKELLIEQTNKRVDFTNQSINDTNQILRMDADLYPNAPDVIADGNIFSLKKGQQTNLVMPCGGGPDFDMYEDSLKYKKTVILHKITPVKDAYDLDLTYGDSRQTLHFNTYPTQEETEVLGVPLSHVIFLEGDGVEDSGMILEIMRVDEDKIFLRGIRRAC